MTGAVAPLPGVTPRFDFGGFDEFVFPTQRDIVYVFCFRSAAMAEPVPFYVGESSRHVGRFGGYLAANFSASTDFKVGRAVEILQRLGCEVVVRYKAVTDRRDEERSLIAFYEKAGLSLLNRLKGYRYQSAQEPQEVAKVGAFIAQLLAQHGAGAGPTAQS